MRRLLILLSLLAAPAFAFRPSPPPGAHIGILRMSPEFTSRIDEAVGRVIQSDLRGELQSLGFQPFDTGVTYEDLARGGGPSADYYVEIISGDATDQPVAGAGVGNGSIGINAAVLVSHVAAAVRLYDGQTLQTMSEYDLRQTTTRVVPTSIDLGRRFFWMRIPLPFARDAQIRSTAHAVAHQAASRIAGE